jgi:CheY-like chemotaxis protein
MLPRCPQVLIVDDHADTASLWAAVLRGSGYTVKTAETCAAAKLLAAAHPFNVVLCDLGLPDGDGRALLRELRAIHGIKGIALTGFSEPDDIRTTREAGFELHLVKPVTPEALTAAVKLVLEGRIDQADSYPGRQQV